MPRSVPTICPYCGAGCGFYVNVEKGRATNIEYMADHPASEGALCSKANASLEVLYHPDRLLHPVKRSGDQLTRISWDEALEAAARGLAGTLRRFGPDAIGILSSSKCSNEENYLIQKLARLLGTRNVDNCARLCHAPSVVGLNRSLGAAGMTNPFADLANSRCIFVIGSNLAENHPVMSRWIHKARSKGAIVIVADPRRTPTSWMADHFLQLRPGTDVALINAMASVAIEQGLIDRQFLDLWTCGYQELKSSVKDCTPSWAEGITGVPAEDIVSAAQAYAASPASSILYSMGITQHTTGTDNVQALANLALICGQIGREGTGLLPLRGQNNVQGACDMGALAEFYPGYRRADDPSSIEHFRQAWSASDLPVGRGLTATEMIDAAADGRIRAMYIVGEDPVNSEPHGGHTITALESLDLLVVQDIFMTATASHADLVLPAAAWAEKEGTYTSTERRVQWSCRAVDPPGEARTDLQIVCSLGKRLGLPLDYPDASAVLAEINRLVPAYQGITRDRLGPGGLIWPCPSVNHPGTPILHSSGFKTADGRATLLPVHYRPPAEKPSERFPFTLTTGRIALHHNAGSMTRRSPSLMQRAPNLFVEINPADAARLQIEDGDDVEVSTARGRTRAAARTTGRVSRGVVFMPFHFPGTNILTPDARDSQAGIPEFKVAACNISRSD
ncbi:MAG TPA: formate dehydrogenase subunit alpha [Methanotrichaceae archaeon]|nr:formate dehydrogenase subunit alpha [Methanotrichaceae archaeon]HQF17265.1 formate dehydrogenase subunit alpha [Methanotrichaceae archaeon]HQI91838.1 formate dehydrogenase subunit alpha [Methanotrichaceae archaeon]HQJ29168.1 formate dehydrogenase subunit alpha [Methanotrichaceae archaeon]